MARGMQKKHRKEIVGSLIAIVVGIATYYEVRSWRGRENAIDAPRYLTAKRGLSTQSPIGVTDFSAGFFDPAVAPPEAYTDQDWHFIEGRKLRRPLGKGDFLLETDLEPRRESLVHKIPKGFRAYSVSFEGASRVQSGDLVDVLTTSGEAAAGSRSQSDFQAIGEPVISGVKVLVAPRAPSFETVLLLTPRQIQLLEMQRQSGKLTLALRNPEELPEATKPSRRNQRPKNREPNRRITIVSEES